MLPFIAACKSSEVKIARDGDILSPKGDNSNKYRKNAHETWLLEKPSGYWALIFQSMSIEMSHDCGHDYIEIKEIGSRFDILCTKINAFVQKNITWHAVFLYPRY